ncbi:DNA primase catalytic subunit PriS [Methanohalobium sp.]|uniref:DNA primase catalytic subunit PriS n=1 Tax=Methanohalobium sp. TaxID=2837493 RepID=UPI0025EB22B6|nr:DNA primase catalytic subunit PriS [Methanohalobium sp.]
MNDKTLRFLKKRFQDYYQDAHIHLPPEYTSREWGFILFDDMPKTVMRRHMAFGSSGELQDYFSWTVPAHAYYSVAYYEYPNASNMKDKNWLQSDLIFDLDADHLPHVPDSYPEMLENVKQEALKLYDFLSDDFGFGEDDINIVFSGGRGYHFHISHPSVRSLGSAERREIVDYISGRGLDISQIIGKSYVSGDSGRRDASMFVFPSENDGGWGAKINRYIISYISNIVNSNKPIKKLTDFSGVGKTTAEKLVNIFNDEKQLSLLKKGKIDMVSNTSKNLFEHLGKQAVDNLIANVDEPVTADVKRLIRVPGSLHGGSGLRVTTLSASELEDFKPLENAVVFKDNPITVNVTQPSIIEMKGNKYHVDEGVQDLPEYAAIYLMCRGGAEYGSN